MTRPAPAEVEGRMDPAPHEAGVPVPLPTGRTAASAGEVGRGAPERAAASEDGADAGRATTPAAGGMSLDDLLLSFAGRIGRGRFLLGLFAIAVVVGATGLIFRLGDGTFCRMRWGEPLANVWIGALATMGVIVAAMLLAVCWKRMADIGLWRVLAVPPVLFAAALPLAWRIEALGPCGTMTAERAVVVVWAGIGLAASLSLHFLAPARGRAARDKSSSAAAPAAKPVNE